jgi:UDP-N-acetylglucosamine--N-acetylmuramyl-(pentapeptide) pyrophosphoryl-undecaprenol N-acetylglucosamine transferase
VPAIPESSVAEINGSRLKAQGSRQTRIQASNLKSRQRREDPQAVRSSNRAPRALSVVMAGGGTGGHLFPGLAIAQEFMTRNQRNSIVFVSTGNALERSLLSETDFKLETITVEGIKGRGLRNQALSALKLPKAIIESLRILKDCRPDLTVGLGSYSAGPVVVSAWLRGTKIVLHEQNILPGITTRILSRFADRIYVSFEETRARFDPHKVRLTGNPVRAELLNNHQDHELIRGSKSFCVLIIGGSQGAHSINRTVIEALNHLTRKENLFFIHQTGSTDEQMVRAAYQRRNIAARVQVFFRHMAPLYKQADLIICRAGATTVAEITALGKAVIFIPFPFATDDHQALNAGTLARQGAAEIILEKDLNAALLGQKIDYYATHPRSVQAMAARASRLGHPDAARAIVDDCYRLVGIGS